jgi:DNA-directed RNA polymerase specialized sigma subunit
MKIQLSHDDLANLAINSNELETLTNALAGCRAGDWESKHELERIFQSLLVMMATKRTGDDVKQRTRLIERGRAGLYRAAKRFPKREPAKQFRIFALPFIEAAMDEPPSFWQKLQDAWRRACAPRRP